MRKQSLRTQLLGSHLVLVGLMSLVMVGALFNFFRLGFSIDHILKDNYKSVIAAQTMQEALERQDSATTFFLAGQADKARKQYQYNRRRFEKAYKIEANNITESGEQQESNSIAQRYEIYQKNVERLLYGKSPLSSEAARAFYFGTLEPQFVDIKESSQRILEINQAAIVRADERAKNAARNAAWMGIAMTIGALLLAVIFAYRAINSALTPLLALAQGAEEIGVGHLNRSIELHRTDEIGTLAQSFNMMAKKLREARHVEQQRLHRAQQMSDAALESLYDPVIVTDATGSVVHLNRAAQGLFGPAEKASGLPIAQAVSEPRLADAVERAVRQERVSDEEGEESLVPLQVGGTQRTYRMRATPMRDDDGTLLGAALVLEDITHLHELSRLKTEFISVASHELRTPVTSLLLSAQLLEECVAGPLTAEQAEIVAAQREDLARLDLLLRDLLDITRLEAGSTPPRFEIVPPHDLLEMAHNSVASQAANKKVNLSMDVAPDLPAVRADRAQIIRVLVNLLGNAIRHTPASGTVKIAVGRDDAKVFFRVHNTGPCIPPEYLPRIFERFVQVPGATRGGAGLGLSIAQTIIKAHGTEITAKSTTEEGTTFEFALPVEENIEVRSQK